MTSIVWHYEELGFDSGQKAVLVTLGVLFYLSLRVFVFLLALTTILLRSLLVAALRKALELLSAVPHTARMICFG